MKMYPGLYQVSHIEENQFLLSKVDNTFQKSWFWIFMLKRKKKKTFRIVVLLPEHKYFSVLFL